jgi:hypothetical protein
VLSLMSPEEMREDLNECRIMTVMQVILCGTNGEIIDLAIGIHGLVANDEIVKERMLGLGVQEILNEVESQEINEEAANTIGILMNTLTGTS